MAMEQNLKSKDIGLKEMLHFGNFQKKNAEVKFFQSELNRAELSSVPALDFTIYKLA